MKTNYKDGKAEGMVHKRYENGKSSWKGQFKNGERNGSFKKWFQSGTLREKKFYKNGSREGLWVTWHSNGRKEREAVYRNDVREGVFKEWDFEGCEISKKLYEKGILLQSSSSFSTGKKKGKGSLDEKTGIYTHESWHENGNLRKKSFYDGKIKGKKIGIWKGWDDDGNKEFEQDFNKGGETTKYWKNGNVKSKTNWKAGKLNGLASYYSKDETLNCSGEHIDGKREGVWQVNGQNVNYSNGKRQSSNLDCI